MATKKQHKITALTNLIEQLDTMQFTGSVSEEDQLEVVNIFNDFTMKVISKLSKPVKAAQKRIERAAAKVEKKELRKAAMVEKKAAKAHAKELKGEARAAKKAERQATKEAKAKAREEAKAAAKKAKEDEVVVMDTRVLTAGK